MYNVLCGDCAACAACAACACVRARCVALRCVALRCVALRVMIVQSVHVFFLIPFSIDSLNLLMFSRDPDTRKRPSLSNPCCSRYVKAFSRNKGTLFGALFFASTSLPPNITMYRSLCVLYQLFVWGHARVTSLSCVR